MNTDDFIDRLAHDLTPVAPLPRPAKRAAAWLAGAVIYVGVFLALTGRGDAVLGEPRALLAQLTALATGVLACHAAFASVVPGYSWGPFVWPAVTGAAWLGLLCMGPAPSAAADTHEWACVGLIVLGGAPLLATLVAMLRRGAAFTPAVTGALAALAVGMLANVGTCLWRPHAYDTAMLAWHGAAILVLTALCAGGARFVLRGAQARPVRSGLAALRRDGNHSAR
jgi:hypothetical protein